MQTNGIDFQTEQNQVLQYMLDSVTDPWKLPVTEQEQLYGEIGIPADGVFLELFITPSCNQACSYCYLQQFGDKIYPKEIRDSKIIISNLHKLLNYYLENKYHLKRVDLFSGEIWGYPFGNEILEILLEYIKKGLDIKLMIIPSNCSFCRNKEMIKVINDYIERFDELDCRVCFSCSMDGLFVDPLNRPFLNDDKTAMKTYYQDMFSFIKQHEFGFHPMIAADNIELQKENYKAWIKIVDKVYPYYPQEDKFGAVMQLEVRNDNWTEEKILSYLDWLNFVIDTDLKEYFNNDKEKFMPAAIYSKNPGRFFANTYIPYSFGKSSTNANCTIGQMICVRLGDLAICPCHRTSYDKFLFGKYKVENDKIIGVEANNLILANVFYRTSLQVGPKCDTCILNKFCLRGCYGSNYESTGDIMYPGATVCDFYYAKFTFLILKYKAMGYFSPEKLEKDEKLKHHIGSFITDFEQKEEYIKWKKLIQNKISIN